MRRKAPSSRLVALLLVTAGCYTGAAGVTPGPDGDGHTDGEAEGGDEPQPPHPADACSDPDPSSVTLHRLNRVEYDNTLRDLLGLTLNLSATFPAEAHVEGFDNNADGLTLAPLHVEKYLAAGAEAAEATLADPTARARLVSCDPAPGQERACAEAIFGAFLPRAYRRPVTDDEIAATASLALVPLEHGDDFEQGLRLALQSVLVSPHFLYRPEPAPADTAPGEIYELDGYALASRLSYLLWSSMPDDELLALADAGQLSGRAAIEQQVRRMLADPKAEAFVLNFAGQWLHARAMAEARPDEDLFPEFDEPLRASLEQETYAFFTEALASDEPLRSLLTADWIMADARLAEHYGLPADAVPAQGFARVAAPDGQRGGLLRQGSVLTVTSHPTRTSPVKRGKWVIQQLMCLTPPPPPPGVEQLPQDLDPDATQREIFEQHRADPSCRPCHELMDPIGFGLEHYDAIGAFRQLDNGQPIDASGRLPEAGEFTDAQQLGALIAEDPRFSRCVTRNVFTYALGRGMTDQDQCVLEAVADELTSSGGSLADLLVMVASSPTATTQRLTE